MLRQANRVKRITDSSGGDLSAAAGKSLLIKSIYCIPHANDTYLTLSVDRVTVGVYRVGGRAGNQVSPYLTSYHIPHIMDFLTSKGINIFIPVAEGQTFNVSRVAETGNVMIVYDEYDAGDIRADMPNGSAAAEYTFIQYMSSSETPLASQDILIDTSLSPAEFPDFPCGKNVPASHTITMLGIAGHPFTTGGGMTTGWGTTFVKMIREREVLFDEDRNGIPFDAQTADPAADVYACNFSLIGPCTPVILTTPVQVIGDPLMFDPPLVFGEGEELNIYLSGIMLLSAAWEETMIDLEVILNVKKA